MKEVSY